MALNFYELAQSRPVERAITSASVTLKWIAMYSTNENVVYAALLLVAPTRWDNLRRSKITLDPQGGGVWMCAVEYAWTAQTQDAPDTPPNPDANTPLGAEWSFDGAAQTVHVTQSIKTISKTGRANNAVQDTFQAIGLKIDGVEGCDIFAPKLEVSLTLSFQFINIQQIQLWNYLTARTNSAFFLNWNAGELLYMGPTVQIQPGNLVKATHKFLAARNLTLPGDKADLTIVPEVNNGAGTGLILPAKKGHEYVWCMYENANPAPGAPWVLNIPFQANVEQVYKSADFTPLLFGS